METSPLEPQPLDEMISAWMRESFVAAFPDQDLATAPIDVVATADKRHGDYQCNGAMPLAKLLKQAPRGIAQQVVDGAVLPPFLQACDIAGPGFINLTLDTDWLAARLDAVAGDRERLGVRCSGANRTVVLDYSGPNVAKQMHIGHIRSTVIGNALDRMHRFAGFRVISDNHVGDWGTQFGILIMGYRTWLDEEALERDPVAELERLYVASTEAGKQDEAWMDQARAELVKLQQGDAENLALWRTFLALSQGEFDRLYDRLGVTFDLMRGESFYNERLAELLDRLRGQGISQESNGARVVFLEEEGLPVCIVQKSDGAANYATTDVATIESRVEEFDPETILYVTDERQQTHFNQVFAVARKLGVTINLEHQWFGLMRLPEGTFSTRDGNVIKLQALLDEAEKRALDIVKASSPEMDPTQQREVARAVGIGAVKYADLSMNRQSLITFTWEKALALDGNSAPYLQYAYARIASVQDKYAERFPGHQPADFAIRLAEPVERDLAIQLLRFSETLERAIAQYKPNLLAEYLFNLAQSYSSFYQNVPFLKAEEGVRESRVRICGLVAAVLRKGLELLGIETPERI